MQYKILNEKVYNLDEFRRVLSDIKVADDVLLSELDRLYAEWQLEEDFYFFLEEEYSELEELKTATGESELFRLLIGDSHRGVSLLAAREEKRQEELLVKEKEAQRIVKHCQKEAAKAGHTVAAEVLKDIGRTRATSNEIGECEGDEKIKRVQLWKDGPYWAERNIGAENPWDSGYYFWWGDTIGYERKNDGWVASDGSNPNFSFNEGNTFTYDLSESELRRQGWITPEGVLSSDHDAAHKHWGGGWRMPTKADFENLVNKCDWQWTRMNGVEGYVVRGRGKYASKSIFFLPPATATVLRSTIPVLKASIGRPFLIRTTTTTRGISTSFQLATIRAAASAPTGSPFVQF